MAVSRSPSGKARTATVAELRPQRAPAVGQPVRSVRTPANKPKKPEKKPRERRRAGSVEMPLISFTVFLVLSYAWSQRNEGHITAETGLGYWLGIFGGLMMLALLVYPLRKRLPILRRLGEVRSWFRWHMILGVVGPALVVLHSNFKLGSLNSRVALTTMLVVAGSGFIGRFLYARIHRGLYGKRDSARESIESLSPLKEALNIPQEMRGAIREELEKYETGRVCGARSVRSGLANVLSGPFSRRSLRRGILSKLAVAIGNGSQVNRRQRKQLAEFKSALNTYLKAVARAEAFSLYERLFALWHLLHLPLFAILVLAATVHVVAVHLY